jgi:hypothetical protein
MQSWPAGANISVSRSLLTPENVELWASGLTDFEALSPEQQRRFIFIGATEWHFVENLLQQRDRGHLTADEIETWVAYFTSVIRTPGGVVWWGINKKLFRANLVAEIDRRVQSSGQSPHLLQMIPQLEVRTGG